MDARKESLTIQGEFLAELMAELATADTETGPVLDPFAAGLILRRSFIFEGQRARLFDSAAQRILDSNQVSDRVEMKPLAPVNTRPDAGPTREERQEAAAALREEVAEALAGETVTQVRRGEDGRRVVSVSIPVRRVRAPLGVITLEAGDFNEVLSAQRRALLPFILVAVAVSLL